MMGLYIKKTTPPLQAALLGKTKLIDDFSFVFLWKDQLQAERLRLRAPKKSIGSSVDCERPSRARVTDIGLRELISSPPMKKTTIDPPTTAGQNGEDGIRVATSEMPAATKPTYDQFMNS
jgi:hypothetical protein